MDAGLQKLCRMKEKMPNFREILELAEKILALKRDMKAKWAPRLILLDPQQQKIHLQEGFPFLRPGEIRLDPSLAEEYFNSLLGILKEQNPKKHEPLLTIIGEKKFQLAPFLKGFLDGGVTEGHLEKERGAEGSLLFFFGIQTLKPFFENLAEQWRKDQKEFSWGQGFCPFCGGYPELGEIREEGKRFLHCPLCATQWDYPRLKCPYCQNEDQEKLTYFQVEGETGQRVDICLLCRHYLKTVDSRESGEPLDAEVEDFLTLHLDHLAQEEGFMRPDRLFVEVG